MEEAEQKIKEVEKFPNDKRLVTSGVASFRNGREQEAIDKFKRLML